MTEVVTQIAGQLGRRTANAGYYTDNAARVGQERPPWTRVGSVRAVATRPRRARRPPEDAGLHDDTPAEFAEAIDAETDAPPAALNDETPNWSRQSTLRCSRSTSRPPRQQRQRLRTTAQEAGTPVVEFTETVPDGRTYQQWMARTRTTWPSREEVARGIRENT
ncbi:hypothetical protein QJS66_23210 [Kocuria rhizophila]|nr:hypothetical protein QJS66_23210 [Kocuria rhizophila]